MTIPAAYQVGLGLYGIDAETLALRAEVWKILGPHLDAIMEKHFTGVRTHAPFYADMLTKQRRRLQGARAANIPSACSASPTTISGCRIARRA